MKKNLILGSLLIMILMMLGFTANNYAAASEAMKGVWVWNSTVRQLGDNGAKILVSDLHKSGFTDIFLLVKGMNGIAGYPSKVALEATPGNRDLLGDIIAEAHQNHIKVHAWLMIHGDKAWANKYPEDQMIHIANGPKEGMISLLSVRYQQYIQNMVKELIANYDIDGIHLDGIRLTHVVYSFDSYILAETARRRINVEKVKTLIGQDPKGASAIMQAYQKGDPDITAWEQMRRDAVVGFAKGIKAIVKSAKRSLVFSAALMPEGATDPVYADVYYGQNYQDAAKLYDFIFPMAYWKDFHKEPQWVGASVIKSALNVGIPVIAGLQAYEVSGSRVIEAATNSALSNGAKGVVYFRYGTFAFALMRITDGPGAKTLLTVELTNRTETPVDTVELLFAGTGLTPKAVSDLSSEFKTSVSEGKVSLAGGLEAGKTVTFTVAVVKDSTGKVLSQLPAVNLAKQNQASLPVYVMMQ